MVVLDLFRFSIGDKLQGIPGNEGKMRWGNVRVSVFEVFGTNLATKSFSANARPCRQMKFVFSDNSTV